MDPLLNPLDGRPTILVIDDDSGCSPSYRNLLCKQLGLRDVTPLAVDRRYDESGGNFAATDSSVLKDAAVLANAVFVSGMRRVNGRRVADLEGLLEVVRSGWTQELRLWSLILLDYEFELTDCPQFGAVILDALVKTFPFQKQHPEERQTGLCDIPVIMFSANSANLVESETDRRGSQGFFPRPDSGSASVESQELFSQLLFDYGLVQDGHLYFVNSQPNDPQVSLAPYRSESQDLLCGRSLAHLRLLLAARRCVQNQTADGIPLKNTVLLLGERGVGKGEIARYIHVHSRFGTDEPVNVFLSGVPDSLVESELFGHAKGAFTGADTARESPFHSAGDGTVFIDEIGNLPINLLNKLLICVGERRYKPVGGKPEEQARRISCTMVFATNKNVFQMMDAGLFPPDLFDRMDDVIFVPSLQDRRSDIIPLFEALLRSERRTSRQPEDCEWPVHMTPDAAEWITNQPWPGNIRELKALVRRIARRRRFSATFQKFDLEAESVTHEGRGRQIVSDVEEVLKCLEQFRPDPNLQLQQLQGIEPKFREVAGRMFVRIISIALRRTESHGKGVNAIKLAELLFGVPITSSNKTDGAKRSLRENLFQRYDCDKVEDLPEEVSALMDRLAAPGKRKARATSECDVPDSLEAEGDAQ
jgi:DNA-binding NtrC family response regulator